MSETESTIEKDLQTLELEAGTAPRQISPQDARNPFERRKRSKSLNSFSPSSCGCRGTAPKARSASTFKPGKRKILREPVLKLIAKCSRALSDAEGCSEVRAAAADRLFGQCGAEKGDHDFRTIIQGYEQLSLANAADGSHDYSLPSFRSARSPPCSSSLKQTEPVANVQSSCAHQARMSAVPPCDVTINELASYFETFIHIPKKMSSMAEMMYI